MSAPNGQDPAGPEGTGRWGLILSLGVATLALGWVGFARYHAAHDLPATFWYNLYLSLQLFTLESGSVPAPLPLALNVARFLAPLVSAWALVKTLFLLFGDRIRSMRLRRLRGHVVVCGLGRRGTQLVRDFRANGDRVVAIERDGGSAGVSICRGLGAQVLVGSATDPDVLRTACAGRAAHVVAVTGDDGVNAGVAVRVYQLVRDRKAKLKGTVHCWIQVVDLRLATLLQHHHILTETRASFEAHIFDTYHATARQLLADHPLDHEPFGPEDPRRVHLIIAGFGAMGESLTVQAARIGSFANGLTPRVTVVDLRAGQREREFAGDHPQVGDLVDLAFVAGDVRDPAVLERIRGWADETGTLTTIAVCLDDDTRSLSCALGVLSRLDNTDTPLLVRMSESDGLATLLDDEVCDATWARVDAFGTVEGSCTREALLHEELDAIARVLHEDFVEKRLAEGRDPDDPSLRPWERLDESLKASSRASADHIPVKLRAVDCHAATDGDAARRIDTFTDPELELLGRMEHARWCAERRLAGWTPGARRPPEKETPDLVPWDELTDDVKKLDFDVVAGIPRFLASVGKRVYRNG